MTDELELIALRMLRTLPREWVYRVAEQAQTRESYRMFLVMWRDAEDDAERDAVVADLQELLDDREPSPDRPVIRSSADLDALVRQRRAHKDHLRAMIDARGGVSEVARKAGIPQPSLSRMLTSGAAPRASTLAKLAAAMGVSVSRLTPDAGGEEGDAEVFDLGNYRASPPVVTEPQLRRLPTRASR